MSAVEHYENFDQFSNRKYYNSKMIKENKFKNISSFIEYYITVFYDVYKKNKDSNISFPEYRKLMLQKLREHYNPGMKILDPGEKNRWKNN